MEDILKSLLTTPEGISIVVNQYKPLVYTACKELFGVFKDLIDNDEYFEMNAKYYRKKFDALVTEGFTESQALSLMIAEKQAAKDYVQKASGTSAKIK